MYLTTADYAVTVVMLLIPVSIGIFYAWKDSKNVTREEYLLGGRKMGLIPVALSMFVTFQSAISLIGFTSDVYGYGTMVLWLYTGNMLGTFIGLFTLVPIVHPLKMTSVYDYLERRYKSHAVRMMSTVIGMLQTYMYMVVALVAPGLALQTGANIPFWMSVAVVGGIGTLYTAIGGIKSVIWTDVFQAVLIVGGLLLIIIRGTIAVGGPGPVFDIADEGQRITLDRFSPDPRIRHTWWGMVFGGTFLWMPHMYSQSNFLRIASMKTLRSARVAFGLNISFFFVYTLLIGAVGVIIYSYFYVTRCDPLEAGIISNINQVSIYFMIHLFQDTPGLAGLYMATIFSGALSTLSSGINALAANTVEDILANRLGDVSEMKATFITKIVVFIYGFSIIGAAYLFRAMPGPVSQISTAVVGAFGSVVVGMFLMGCLVPWANKYGAFSGAAVAYVLNIWLIVGGFLHGFKTRRLPSAPTDNCPSEFYKNSTSSSTESNVYFTSSTTSGLNGNFSYATNTLGTSNDDSVYEYGFFLHDISYEWYGLIGALVCSVTILIASKLTRRYDRTKTEAVLILPSLRRFWHLDDIPTTENKELEPLKM